MARCSAIDFMSILQTGFYKWLYQKLREQPAFSIQMLRIDCDVLGNSYSLRYCKWLSYWIAQKSGRSASTCGQVEHRALIIHKSLLLFEILFLSLLMPRILNMFRIVKKAHKEKQNAKLKKRVSNNYNIGWTCISERGRMVEATVETALKLVSIASNKTSY
jgi:hypothetical protein